MADEERIRVGQNDVEVVGTVTEYNLTVKQNKKKCNVDGEDKEITSAIIFGTINVDVNGKNVKTNVLTSKHSKSANEIKSFKGLCTIAGISYEGANYERSDSALKPSISGKTTLVTLVNGNETRQEFEVAGVGKTNATRVIIKGSLDKDEYLNKDRSGLVVGKKISIGYVSTSNVPEDDKATFAVEGYITHLDDELNQKDSSKTGRKIVTFLNTTFFGVTEYSMLVPEKWNVEGKDGEEITVTAKEFADFCADKEVARSVIFNGDIETFTIGNTVSSPKKSFGAKSHITSGYDITEWIIKGVNASDEPYNNKKMKEAQKEYEIYLDAQYQKKLEQQAEYEKKKNSFSSNSKPKGLGQKTKTDFDDPFADDEDDDMENPFA